MPGTKPYTWGIYLGLSTLLVGVSFLGVFVALYKTLEFWDAGFAVTSSVASIVSWFGAMRRHRFWLTASVLL